MDPSVYDGLLDVMDHRDSFSPLLSEKGSISNLLLLTTLNIIPLRKLASLKTFLVDLTIFDIDLDLYDTFILG